MCSVWKTRAAASLAGSSFLTSGSVFTGFYLDSVPFFFCYIANLFLTDPDLEDKVSPTLEISNSSSSLVLPRESHLWKGFGCEGSVDGTQNLCLQYQQVSQAPLV